MRHSSLTLNGMNVSQKKAHPVAEVSPCLFRELRSAVFPDVLSFGHGFVEVTGVYGEIGTKSFVQEELEKVHEADVVKPSFGLVSERDHVVVVVGVVAGEEDECFVQKIVAPFIPGEH